MPELIGLDEDLPVESKHDVYPFIDPSRHYMDQTFKGKVVLVTGASRGIGQETAVQFDRAGANIVLVARTEGALEETKDTILKARPEAQVVTFPADVTDTARAQEIVRMTVAKFGRLDVHVANAGMARAADAPFTDKDPLGWWRTSEVNPRDAYNYTHFAVPELKKTCGVLIASSVALANIRLPFNSEYAISKHALNWFIEFMTLEHSNISAFSVHPGVIETEMAKVAALDNFKKEDMLALPAAVYLFSAPGRAPYPNGRYVSASWDLEQVEREWKDKIINQNGLVSKLYIPAVA